MLPSGPVAPLPVEEMVFRASMLPLVLRLPLLILLVVGMLMLLSVLRTWSSSPKVVKL